VFVSVALPEDVARVTVSLGSLAVDGVSLTVNDLDDRVAELAIIPHTWHHTNLERLSPGVGVNLEADLIAKYVERLLSPHITRL
jgi:riboflavin synthase